MELPVEETASPVPPGEGPAGLHELEPGAWVGRYQVEALLGRGGMGSVYRVRDSILERSVALKAIRFGEVGDPMVLSRFRREAMALAQLNHRNVCQVHDWLEWGDGAFIAMELVVGKTLAEAGPGMSFTTKLSTLRAIASALKAAHAKGIVHRDLKPINIMLDASGQVKVLDFGLARLLDNEDPETGIPQASSGDRIWAALEDSGQTSMLPPEGDQATQVASLDREAGTSGGHRDSLTQVGSFLGSPAYASPEQVARLPVGPPSDIFSLGIVAWELLLGDHPFPGHVRERMASIQAGRRQSLRGRKLHPQLKSLLKEMLARNPNHRPSAEKVVERLNRQLDPFPVTGWILIGAASLMAVLVIAHALFGRSIIADLMKDRPPRVAVLPIQNATGDPSLGPLVEVGMTELLATALRESSHLAVVDSEFVTRVFTTLRMDSSHPLDADQQARVAHALGAPLMLTGTLDRVAPSGALRFTYVLKTKSGQVRYSGRVSQPVQGAFMAFGLVEPAAAELLKKVDPLAPTTPHGKAPPPEAYASYARGKALLLSGDFKGSEALLRDAALKAPAFSQAVTAYASCLRRLGKDSAVLVTNWAIMASRATGDRWAEGRALGVKAYLARDQGDLAEAESLRRLTLTLAESTRDLEGAAVATNHLGLIEAERGQDAQAAAFYNQSLSLARQLSDQTYIALAQNNLANLALKRGDLKGAMTRYQEVLETQRGIGNRFGEGLALNNLGVVALTAGSLAEAEGYLTKALAIREAVGETEGKATSMRNIGILCLMKGDLASAKSWYEKALDMARACGVRAHEAECRFYLGDLLRYQKRLVRAEEEYRAVLELLNPGFMSTLRAQAQAGLVECQVRSNPGRSNEARHQLETMAPAFRNSAYTLRAWAWIYLLSGETGKGRVALERALADPEHTAPEIRRELEGMAQQFN